MGLQLFYFFSHHPGPWALGHMDIWLYMFWRRPFFHISGFYFLFYLHQRGESVLTWFCVLIRDLVWC